MVLESSVVILCRNVVIQVKGSVNETRTVRVSVTVSAVSYTGGSASTVKKEQGKISLSKGIIMIQSPSTAHSMQYQTAIYTHWLLVNVWS